MKICVIGLGYIGLPTATVIAQSGLEVLGCDLRADIVEAVNQGRTLISEPGLSEQLRFAVESGKLKASNAPQAADVFVIAVPTPILSDHSPDMQYVFAAIEAISSILVPENLILLESTSPVGTTNQTALRLAELRPDLVKEESDGNVLLKVHLAYCPERILPGRMLEELVENDRIVGGLTPYATECARNFYAHFVRGQVHETSATSAEFVKLAENSFRDVNIAFANELASLCEAHRLDPYEVISLANYHPRVSILRPGIGVGGHCIAVDPWFLYHSAPDRAQLIKLARIKNDQRPSTFVEQVVECVTQNTQIQTIACLGLAYKPNVDDLRESPAVEVVEKLLKAQLGCSIIVVEPNITNLPQSLKEPSESAPISLDNNLEAVLNKADLIIFLVGHEEFLTISPSLLKGKQIVDGIGFKEL